MEQIMRSNRYFLSSTAPRKKTSIEVLPVQQQPHSADCSIFAFACVHFIVTGKKTTANAKFSTLKIRVQFLHCLVENNILTKLPSGKA